MGCGSSKKAATAIAAFGTSKGRNRPSSAPTDNSLISSNGASNSVGSSAKQKPSSAASKKGQRPESGGVVSTSAVAGFRGGSAASANSDRSIDSGIGGESRDGSATLARAALPPPGPRFAQQLPAELSALKTGDRPRPRVDEETILASLRQEGLLGAPNTSTTKGGLCFEVPAEELKVRSRRPPPRLQRLEPAPQQTNDQIKQKLATAETRRKKRENEKVQRNREKDAKHLETKLASLDIENDPGDIGEPQRTSSGRLISAKSRRRPPSAVAAPAPPAEEMEVMTPKASPLVIDDIPVGATAKQRFF